MLVLLIRGDTDPVCVRSDSGDQLASAAEDQRRQQCKVSVSAGVAAPGGKGQWPRDSWSAAGQEEVVSPTAPPPLNRRVHLK